MFRIDRILTAADEGPSALPLTAEPLSHAGERGAEVV